MWEEEDEEDATARVFVAGGGTRVTGGRVKESETVGKRTVCRRERGVSISDSSSYEELLEEEGEEDPWALSWWALASSRPSPTPRETESRSSGEQAKSGGGGGAGRGMLNGDSELEGEGEEEGGGGRAARRGTESEEGAGCSGTKVSALMSKVGLGEEEGVFVDQGSRGKNVGKEERRGSSC